MLDLNEQMMEDLGMDEFSDTLFSTLNMPFQFPNPKEMSEFGLYDQELSTFLGMTMKS